MPVAVSVQYLCRAWPTGWMFGAGPSTALTVKSAGKVPAVTVMSTGGYPFDVPTSNVFAAAAANPLLKLPAAEDRAPGLADLHDGGRRPADAQGDHVCAVDRAG